MLSERSTSPNLVDYDLEYERIIGDIENPNYRDIKFDVYIDDEHLSVYFWIDYHDEPLPKELVDMIVKELKLKEFMIK